MEMFDAKLQGHTVARSDTDSGTCPSARAAVDQRGKCTTNNTIGDSSTRRDKPENHQRLALPIMSDAERIHRRAQCIGPGIKNNIRWPEEWESRLIEMWAAGFSCQHIADAIGNGITRNAVIGKVHRLGLPKRVSPNPGGRPKDNRPRRPHRRTRGTVLEMAVLRKRRPNFKIEVIPDAHAFDTAIPQEQRKQLHELERNHCRWPVGDPGSEGFFFCGGSAMHGYSYCFDHCCRAFNYRQEKKAA